MCYLSKDAKTVSLISDRTDQAVESYGEEASEVINSDQHREETVDLGWIEPVSAKRLKTTISATESLGSDGDTLAHESQVRQKFKLFYQID